MSVPRPHVIFALFSHQVRTLDIYNAADCGDKFRSNRYVGLLLFLSIVAGRWAGGGQDTPTPEAPAVTPSAPAPAPAAIAESSGA